MARNLLDIVDFSIEEIDELIAVAEDIIANPVKYQDACATSSWPPCSSSPPPAPA